MNLLKRFWRIFSRVQVSEPRVYIELDVFKPDDERAVRLNYVSGLTAANARSSNAV